MSRPKTELEQACDDTLRSFVSPQLKVSLRRLLAEGHTKNEVLRLVRSYGATRRTFTGLAIEAEVEAILRDMREAKTGQGGPQ